MASDKKRRKAAKARQPKKPGPFRHPDGDRRRREEMSQYSTIWKQKEMLRLIGAVELPPDEDEPTDKS